MRLGSLGLPELLVVVLLFVLLFRARSLPALGRRLGEQARKPFRQAKWLLTSVAAGGDEALRAEEEFGREAAREFATRFEGEATPERQRSLATIGAKLAAALGDEQRTFAFRAVASPLVNAFALPGGFVFATDALLELYAGRPDELAFVVGHEMGHVVRGHARDRLMADMVLNAVTRRLPGAGRALQELLRKGYSREQELEADSEAARLVAAAGFERGAAARALARLARHAPDNTGLAQYFSTHPPMPERIRALALLGAD